MSRRRREAHSATEVQHTGGAPKVIQEVQNRAEQDGTWPSPLSGRRNATICSRATVAAAPPSECPHSTTRSTRARSEASFGSGVRAEGRVGVAERVGRSHLRTTWNQWCRRPGIPSAAFVSPPPWGLTKAAGVMPGLTLMTVRWAPRAATLIEVKKNKASTGVCQQESCTFEV